jgi:hypothetical protein
LRHGREKNSRKREGRAKGRKILDVPREFSAAADVVAPGCNQRPRQAFLDCRHGMMQAESPCAAQSSGGSDDPDYHRL